MRFMSIIIITVDIDLKLANGELATRRFPYLQKRGLIQERGWGLFKSQENMLEKDLKKRLEYTKNELDKMAIKLISLSETGPRCDNRKKIF